MLKPVSRLSRLLHIRRVIRKYSLTSLFDDLALSRPKRIVAGLLFSPAEKTSTQPRGERIRLALEELGPIFVKLGQALSTRPDLVPADIAAELTKLQDQVPAFSAEQSMQIIHQAYGDQFEDIFASIESQPMASASVAQVHAATLKPGLSIKGQNGQTCDQVVVKVLRPGIRAIIDSDLRVMYMLAGALQKTWKRGQQFKPLEVIKEYDHTIHDELNLRAEAANCARMGADFEHTDIIYVPRVYWDYTQPEVMVMERIYGTPIRDFEALQKQGVDFKSLAEDGVRVFFSQAFEHNFFHADMHAGNIFVSDQGKWIAIDFGIMGTLTDDDKQYLATMLLGFFNRDYRAIAQAHLHAGWIPSGTRIEEFEQAIRMVCEPIFAKPLSEISFGNVLMQLFQTIQRFEMPVQPQLVLLYKTLLNIEGLGRQLYPNLNLWDTAKPFLEDWMKQQLSPESLINEFRRDWPRWQALLPKLPNLLAKAMDSTEIKTPAHKKVSTTGLSLVAIGGSVTLLNQANILASDWLANVSPMLVLVGLVVVIVQQR